MTVRQEGKRRGFRAAKGFYWRLTVGLSTLLGTIAFLIRAEVMRDHGIGPVWFILALFGGATTAAASILAGALYAHRMGRHICCGSVWPLLPLGRAVDRMK